MTEMDELKPCPFCGGTDLYWPYGTDPAVVKCGGKSGCGAESGVGEEQTKEASIAAWNRRPSRLEAISEGQPDGWQHRIYYEDTGKWSEWRDGKWHRRNTLDNEFEERPLYAHTPPPGHVVVPVEPTEGMLRAGRLVSTDGALAIYRAMIAALPTEPGIRICPRRDGPCPHGVSCTYWQADADCSTEPRSALPHNGGAK